ncbi:hypothetical protein [Rhodococcus sovatensis]|uniref:Uncharacterized protein n=1 Tax=Rhodococcus sovatensis TaxID=1805840 RepID=A0ABZ2PSS0_9NOCA
MVKPNKFDDDPEPLIAAVRGKTLRTMLGAHRPAPTLDSGNERGRGRIQFITLDTNVRGRGTPQGTCGYTLAAAPADLAAHRRVAASLGR